VGKTTCAAASALGAAEVEGRRVLALSTDPAHSLGDALGARLGPEPVPLKTRRGALLAAELSAGHALKRFQRQQRGALRVIAEHGTFLDDQDVELLLDLSPPGLDELTGMLELVRLARDGGWDEVVVDTAPTAHTLRLLTVPEALRRFAAALDGLQERHRTVVERFGGQSLPDVGDALIAEIEADGRELAERLRDPSATAFTWVMLPEALSLAESRDALAALEEMGVPVAEIVVNRVTPESGCPLCEERRRAEQAVIREIRDAFPGRELRLLPAEPREPRGLAGLRRMARHLASRGEDLCVGAGLVPAREGVNPSPASRRPRTPKTPPAWLDRLAPPGLELLLFGGKGGVGKTTCAAAAALVIASRRAAHRSRRVLLVSTDPAHSLADVLDVPLGDDERPVPGAGGLLARELDAVRAFESWRGRHRAEIGGALASFAGTAEGGLALAGLLEAPPPGVDELFALSFLLDSLEKAPAETEEPPLVVLDTAPAGHALRLLRMPDVALAWDHALLSLLLKYREALRLGDLAAELVELSRGLKKLRARLSDPARTRFVAVTRTGELPRRETARLLESLRDLEIAVPAVLVNAVSGEDCGRCGGEGAGRAVAALRRRCPAACDIMTAPAVFPPPRGVAALAVWAREWKDAP
jgi:arsenite-transporting ATPase